MKKQISNLELALVLIRHYVSTSIHEKNMSLEKKSQVQKRYIYMSVMLICIDKRTVLFLPDCKELMGKHI